MNLFGLSFLLLTLYGIAVHANRSYDRTRPWPAVIRRWTGRPLPDWKRRALARRARALKTLETVEEAQQTGRFGRHD